MLVRSFGCYTLMGAMVAVAGCGATSDPPATGSGGAANGAGGTTTGAGGTTPGGGTGNIPIPGGTGGGLLPSTGGTTGGSSGVNPETCGSNLIGIVRDFSENFPDMEIVQKNPAKQYVHDPGMVAATLGADDKPTYLGAAGGTLSTSGPDAFWHWYNDSDQNQRIELELQFKETATGSMAVDSNTDAEWQKPLGPGGFFPVDNQLFGNESSPAHNYHFTFELHTLFLYQPGQVFTFRGDDDVWVFINKQLVVDLGGVHVAMEQSINLDQLGPALGMTPGNEYAMDFFFAERHKTQSNFRIETNFVFTDCGVVE